MTGEHTDAEQFFRPIASMLAAFGEQFGLRVDKFPKGSSNWDFAFRHPEGGVGLLQVIGVSADTVLIVGHWTLDDRAAGIRYLRSSEQVKMLRSDPTLRDVLEARLREMVQWCAGDWSATTGGFKDLWDRHPRAALGYDNLSTPTL